MAKNSITIRTYLLSFCEDELGLTSGYGVKNSGFNGDWAHYNEIIDEHYQKVFDNMSLTIEIKDKEDIETFKKDFCKRFYNSEIGFEVWAQFEVALEAALNSTCYNLLKFYNLIRNMGIEDMKETSNMKSTSDAASKLKALLNNTPKTDLAIIFDDFEQAKLIKYADSIQEQYSNQTGNNTSIGSNTLPLFQLYNYFAQLPDIEEQIFNILENKIFCQIY